jgi:Holliday junction resolvasome RuvABC DNA-binding subunit
LGGGSHFFFFGVKTMGFISHNRFKRTSKVLIIFLKRRKYLDNLYGFHWKKNSQWFKIFSVLIKITTLGS